MGQQQDGTLPGYPAQGLFGLQALFLEGAPADQTDKIILRRGFGINDPTTWAAIMSANFVPAIIAGSINTKDCNKHNAGRDFRKDVGTISLWGNAVYFCLREYLLTQCPQVSLDWVCKRLKIKAMGSNAIAKASDDMVRLERGDPKSPCLLNNANTYFDRNDTSKTLVGDRVINVGEFTGDLKDVMRRCKTPCEFRVMHSSPLEEGDREALAKMPTELAEKVLSCSDDAPLQLKQENNGGIICVIYMVATMSEEEKRLYAEADSKWLVRSRAHAEVAAQEIKVDADGDTMMGEPAAVEPMEEVPVAEEEAVPVADNEPYPASQPDYVDDDLEHEALRRQLEEEAEQERTRAAKQKRAAPAVAESETGTGAVATKKKTRKVAPKPE
jgi:hypothetical protein